MAQANSVTPMIRPENLDKLPSLDEQKKSLYRGGLARLWQAYEATEKGTTQHAEMESKIRQASAKIMADISKATRPGSATGAQQQARPNSMGGQNPAQARPMQQQPNAQPPQPLDLAQQQAQQAVANNQILPKVRNMLDQITIHAPPNVPPESHTGWKTKWYQEAAKLLMTKERVMAQGRGTQQRINQAQQQGAEIPTQWKGQLEACRRSIKDIDMKWNSMQSNNENLGKAKAMQAQGMAQAGQQQMSNAPTQNQMNQGAASAGQDVKPNQQGAAASPGQGGFQQQAGQAAPQPPQPQQQSSQTFQNFPQGEGMGIPRPAPNVQVPQNAPQQAPAPVPNAQAQNSQRPQPLSQQAAMAQAREQHDRAPTQAQANVNAPQQAIQPQVANPMAFPTQSASQNTPSSAYPPQNSMQGPNNKFHIPKTLTLDPRTQQPVAGPPSRPTLANQGMTTQPGLTRPQPFTLEGEGDRVLSKRKLDELVRQVTGSSDTSPEAGGLTPDVEDAVLSLADDFVDNVITSACRLAKLRSGQTLDIKDVQMVLERNYGIRIPGYSLDEVRTVRKFQPAPGWQSKMQAIQTAKTLGGVKGDT